MHLNLWSQTMRKLLILSVISLFNCDPFAHQLPPVGFDPPGPVPPLVPIVTVPEIDPTCGKSSQACCQIGLLSVCEEGFVCFHRDFLPSFCAPMKTLGGLCSNLEGDQLCNPGLRCAHLAATDTLEWKNWRCTSKTDGPFTSYDIFYSEIDTVNSTVYDGQ